MALKGLFGKLVKNYGDDAARLIANKGDDVARAVATKGDDALRAVDTLDDALPFVGTKNVRSNYDVKRLWDDGDVVSINGRAFKEPSDDLLASYFDSYNDYSDWLEDFGEAPLSFESYIGREGVENLAKENILQHYVEGSRTYDAPVFSHNPMHGNGVPHPLGYGGERPHANTALGKWWKRNYRNGAQYLDPIGPLPKASWDTPWEEILPNQELPF